MVTAKGVQRHPIFKLGKAKARRDPRNLKLKTILRAPVKVPKEYDFDTSHTGVPTPVFANDRLGDCVIAGRAHQTLRFELIEQAKVIAITDADVVREYFLETGGADSFGDDASDVGVPTPPTVSPCARVALSLGDIERLVPVAVLVLLRHGHLHL